MRIILLDKSMLALGLGLLWANKQYDYDYDSDSDSCHDELPQAWPPDVSFSAITGPN